MAKVTISAAAVASKKEQRRRRQIISQIQIDQKQESQHDAANNAIVVFVRRGHVAGAYQRLALRPETK